MRSRLIPVWLLLLGATSFILAPTARISHASNTGMVISAMYSNGSRVGAPYTHDYIELFNAGTIPVNLDSWSLQYRHADDSSNWQKTLLPSIILQPGQYFLAEQDTNLPTRAEPLPPRDVEGPADMQENGSFVVLLLSTTRTTEGPDPRLHHDNRDDIEDMFGGSGTTVFEGQVPTAETTATTAWFRLDGGCQDTDNNLNDFVVANVYQNVRNTVSPLNPCTTTIEPDVTINITDSPDPLRANRPVTFSMTSSNVGTADATGTLLQVHLSGTAILGVADEITQAVCSFASATLTCNIGDLDMGEVFFVEFDMTPVGSGLIIATATVSADAPETTGNNTDIVYTTIRPPSPTTGTLNSTATITSGSSVTVTVADLDQSANPSVTVSAVGTSGDSETLTLPATATAGTFSATFMVKNAAPVASNTELEEPSGALTFTYVDALDADGDINSNRTDVTVVNPSGPAGTNGTITSTPTINSGGSVTVTVADLDLNGNSTVDINAEASNGDTESLVLTATSNPGEFSGSFTVHNVATPTDGNSMLELPSGSITFTYIDALASGGAVNTPRVDTTTVNPFAATGADGSITSTPTVVSGSDVTVTVTDLDLSGGGTVEVTAEATNNDTETLELAETGTLGTFSATFTVANDGTPTDQNGSIELPSGSVTFTYVDALAANGAFNTLRVATTIVNPLIPTGADGSITSTPIVVSGSDVTITVVDLDLSGDGTVEVTAEASNTDSETLELNETATLGTFSGTFTVANNATQTDQNESIELPSGSITFTYVDALDAEGDVDTLLNAVTTVDVLVVSPGSFTLLSPADAEILRLNTTIFSWTQAPDAASYTVSLFYLSTNTRLGETYTLNVSAADACDLSVCSVPGTDFVPAGLEQGTYSWTVIATADIEAEASDGPNIFTVVLNGIELVANGGFEDGENFWVLSPKPNRAKVKCGSFGAGSDCMLLLKPAAVAKQNGVMAGILTNTDTGAGDVLLVSAMVHANRADSNPVLTVKVTYATPTAGVNNNGKDKVKLTVAEITTGFEPFSTTLLLDDAIVSGKVIVKYKTASGKLRVDHVSVQLTPIGVPRATGAEAPAPAGVLPLPAAPAAFRGNN